MVDAAPLKVGGERLAPLGAVVPVLVGLARGGSAGALSLRLEGGRVAHCRVRFVLGGRTGSLGGLVGTVGLGDEDLGLGALGCRPGAFLLGLCAPGLGA